MGELEIPFRFAFIFILLIIANREYRVLENIEKMSWKDVLFSMGMIALSTFLAGGLLYESLVEIKNLTGHVNEL